MLGTILEQWNRLSNRKTVQRLITPTLRVQEYTDDDVADQLRRLPEHYAASWNTYDHFTLHTLNGAVDLDSNTIKVKICSNSYTPSQTNDDYADDATNEVSGTGYSAGGKTLTSASLTFSGGSHLTTFDAADLTWTTVSFTNGRYAVVYRSHGGYSSADELIGYVDFGTNITMAGGDFTISWNASGLLTCTRVT